MMRWKYDDGVMIFGNNESEYRIYPSLVLDNMVYILEHGDDKIMFGKRDEAKEYAEEDYKLRYGKYTDDSR